MEFEFFSRLKGLLLFNKHQDFLLKAYRLMILVIISLLGGYQNE